MTFNWIDAVLLPLGVAAVIATLLGLLWLATEHPKHSLWVVIACSVVLLALLGGFYVR